MQQIAHAPVSPQFVPLLWGARTIRATHAFRVDAPPTPLEGTLGEPDEPIADA